jgi:hypothetical protein
MSNRKLKLKPNWGETESFSGTRLDLREKGVSWAFFLDKRSLLMLEGQLPCTVRQRVDLSMTLIRFFTFMYCMQC